MIALLLELTGISPNAAEHGHQVDQFLELILWFMLILFVIWSSFFVYSLFKFSKKKHPQANYEGLKADWPKHLEWGVIFVEMVLLFGFSIPLWGKRVLNPPSVSEAIVVEAIAQQFGWLFHYPGADGKLGRRDNFLIDPMNPIGLDKNDPASKDDIVTMNEMHVPVGKPLLVQIGSKDVVHNFYIIQMRIQRDAIPGLTIPLWFTPIKTGRFEIACGQLCGVGHFAMKGYLVVESVEEYNNWLKQMAEMNADSSPAQKSVVAQLDRH
ncbi:hypothetical protein IT6_04505 [Methylacidiphilum caldifontis]|uniref:cytochrome c oxidase subunit II n=1 Tax=Methylacidiphilum caldifontis TaxID=2795386 RepID=UPI001A8D3906|nr:hypothetical protein [Methylacidiphilum caldifontis]QSR89540.1 hypothetical protein IT6_04505 [Methylacidiphilum caldifontis]